MKEWSCAGATSGMLCVTMGQWGQEEAYTVCRELGYLNNDARYSEYLASLFRYPSYLSLFRFKTGIK